MTKEMHTRRFCLECQLGNILKPGVQVKSSTLLQAYVTFSSMVSAKSADKTRAAYEYIYAKKTKYKYALLGDVSPAVSDIIFSEVCNSFLSISFGDFLRFIVPDLIGDAVQLMNFFNQKYAHLDDGLLLFSHLIVQIKLVCFNLSNPKVIAECDNYDTAVDKLFSLYKNQETISSLTLSKSDFLEIYKLVNLHPLDVRETQIAHVGYDSKKLYTAWDIFSRLDISREQQREILYRFYVRREQTEELFQRIKPYFFNKIKDQKERKKMLFDALASLASVPPLDALCTVSLYKKASDSPSENLFVPNDISLENGFVFSQFTARTLLDFSKEDEFIILFPTAFFVRKWLSDPVAKTKKTTFVFEDFYDSKLVEYHYREGSYAHDPGDSVKFLYFDQWQAETYAKPAYGKILFFSCGINLSVQSKTYQIIKDSFNQADLFVLLSSFEFEQAKSPFSSELDDVHIKIFRIDTIPQGVNNSTTPRRKIFLQGAFFSDININDDTPTNIFAYTLNEDLNTQALSQLFWEPVKCRQQDLVGLYGSIKELFRKEILLRKATGRKNSAAFSYEFTPDITIWCSKSYPKNNNGRPRIEAYVCEINPEYEREDGRYFANAIATTKKHTVKIPDLNITNWLETEYPFSSVQARHNSKELKEITGEYQLKPLINIRDEIISHYVQLLERKNIAIKTLWYLYPNLVHKYSSKNYDQFRQMACSEIGVLRVGDCTLSECEELLLFCYPDASREELIHRLKILSIALDKAVEYGYCEKNELAEVFRERKLQDKLFSQVRVSTVKKHFNSEEFLDAYRAVTQKIAEGKTEYLGVLLRLLTGLESNIVCALKWKDVQLVKSYGFFQIVVTRQVSNDGTEVKGFDSIEDYLCFPCSLLVQRYLQQQEGIIKQHVSGNEIFLDMPVVSTRENILDGKTRKRVFPPVELEKLCKEIFASLGIDDHIVELPDKEKGTKETNLNRYGGDFFRENFRHWAKHEAKFSPDEVLYAIGNRPATTFGRFYCDFLNDASQLILFVKLLRLDAFLEADNNAFAKIFEIIGEDVYENTFLPINSRRLKLHIRLLFKEINDVTVINAMSPYGLIGSISPTGSVESLSEKVQDD